MRKYVTAIAVAKDFHNHTNWGGVSPLTYQTIKRTFDIVLAAVALLGCLPLILAAMVLVMLESPGSPIFRQKRIGRGGKIFEIYKIRTMHRGFESLCYKTEPGDKRVLRIGSILRAIKVDELPQLLNIIKGEMSIVGPRPLSYEESINIMSDLEIKPNYPGFYPTVRPGLIGLEQVNRSTKLSYEERFFCNYLYEYNLTFLSWYLDLDIFLRALAPCRHVCLLAIVSVVGEFAVLSLW